MSRPFFLLATLVTNILVSAPAYCDAAELDTAAVKNATKLIDTEQKRIWRVAHITVKKFSKCECDKPVVTKTGFQLTYTYTWTVKEKGKDVEHSTKLAFNFSNKGTFEGVPIEDIFEIVSDTSKVKPCDGADLAVFPLRLYMKKNIAALPKSIRAPIEKEIASKITAERALELWLLFRGHVAAPDEKDEK